MMTIVCHNNKMVSPIASDQLTVTIQHDLDDSQLNKFHMKNKRLLFEKENC
jgi:hypothetical protein